MKNNIISLIFFSFISTFFYYYITIKRLRSSLEDLSKGNKIILIRHSLAPGGGDPVGFKIHDCKTQRNLSKKGIINPKKLENYLKRNKVPIDQVLSSQWCRCKDTAKYAFQNYKEFTALNSTFQSPYNKNEGKQLKI